MLARRANGAFVCLRCELHALRPSYRTRLPPATAPAAHARFYSSSTTTKDGSEGQHVEITKKVTRDRPGHKRLARGRTAVLGNMTSLGTEANILVLGEVARRKPTEEPLPEKTAPIEAPSLLASLQQDSRPLSPDEVSKQIDSLRPSEDNSPNEPHRLTRRAFVKLTRTLVKGFTAKQLSSYYAAAKNLTQKRLRRHLADAIKPTKPDHLAPIARTPWQPTSERIDVRLPGIQVLHTPHRLPPTKEALADGILRHIWRLELLEEVEGVGQLELSLRPWQLDLLLNTGRDKATLDKVARNRKAKVQVHRAHNVVRITADQNAAEYAANDIEDTLRNVESATIPFRGWPLHLNDHRIEPTVDQVDVKNVAKVFAQKDLDHVSQLTRTLITLNSDDSALLIKGLNQASVAEAQQYLLKLLPIKNHVKRTYDTEKIDADVDSCYLAPTVHELQSLDYSYRDMALGRWSLPISRNRETPGKPAEPAGSEATTPKATEDKAVGEASVEESKESEDFRIPIDRVIDNIHRQSKQTTTPEKMGFWAREPEYRVSAEFGQALFPLAHPDPRLIDVTLRTPGRELPFQPRLPGLANFLESSSIEMDQRTELPALLYEFVPAPDQKGFPREQQFPTLHIQMRSYRDGRGSTLHKLSLGLPWHEHVHDVLLPDKATDVRFRRYERLRFDTRHHDDKNVADWVEAVRSNIASGGRLIAPPLCLHIPKWTIPDNRTEPDVMPEIPELPASVGLVPVNYLFTGVKVRQATTGKLGDNYLSYITTQSGSMGATGGGLNAYPDGKALGSFNDSPLERDQLAAFVKSCFEITDRITQASAFRQPVHQSVHQSVYQSVQKALAMSEARKPRDLQSARKLKRAALQQHSEQDFDHEVVPESNEDSDEANFRAEQEYDQESISDESGAEADKADPTKPT